MTLTQSLLKVAGIPKGGDVLEDIITRDILGDPAAVDMGFRVMGSTFEIREQSHFLSSLPVSSHGNYHVKL